MSLQEPRRSGGGKPELSLAGKRLNFAARFRRRGTVSSANCAVPLRNEPRDNHGAYASERVVGHANTQASVAEHVQAANPHDDGTLLWKLLSRWLFVARVRCGGAGKVDGRWKKEHRVVRGHFHASRRPRLHVQARQWSHKFVGVGARGLGACLRRKVAANQCFDLLFAKPRVPGDLLQVLAFRLPGQLGKASLSWLGVSPGSCVQFRVRPGPALQPRDTLRTTCCCGAVGEGIYCGTGDSSAL